MGSAEEGGRQGVCLLGSAFLQGEHERLVLDAAPRLRREFRAEDFARECKEAFGVALPQTALRGAAETNSDSSETDAGNNN